DAQGRPVPDPAKAIIPPGTEPVGLPFLWARPQQCAGGVPLPCPEAISSTDNGTFVVNYRNEPLALRLLDPTGGTLKQAAGQPGDLAFRSRPQFFRAIPELTPQPNFCPPLTGDIGPMDPFTPILRAYQGDNIQMRMVVGAHEETHVHTVNGIKWLMEPS